MLFKYDTYRQNNGIIRSRHDTIKNVCKKRPNCKVTSQIIIINVWRSLDKKKNKNKIKS